MKIDCTLDSLLLPALGTYSNEFGTKKLKGGLSTKECCDDTMLPFRKMRPYEVNDDSETTEIQHNAVFVVKTAGITLTLHDSSEDFLGCEARVINVSDGVVTVKGGVSGLDGGIDGIKIPTKREETFIFLSDGWHSMFSGYKNVITQEIADKAVTNSKIADGTVEASKLAISVFNMNYPIGFTYVQFPQQASPNELWGNISTWKVVDYDGAFFRAAGGNAAAYINKTGVLSKQGQSIQSHNHYFTPSGSISSTCSGRGSLYSGLGKGYSNLSLALGRSDGGNTVIAGYNESSSKGYVSANSAGNNFLSISVSVSSSFWGTRKSSESSGDIETRPDNLTIRIWKRTA